MGKLCFLDLRIKGKFVFFICTMLRDEDIQTHATLELEQTLVS